MSTNWFEIQRVESDTSQLCFSPGVGTCLDKSLPKEYEFRIWECDNKGYRGLCGQFAEFTDCLTQVIDLCRDYKLWPQTP